MRIRVRYFAWLRERVGAPAEEVETAAATVGALVDELEARDEAHALAFADLSAVRVAVDEELADFTAPNPEDWHPFGSELGWVACDPAHTGQGLGMTVVGAVTARLLGAGYRNIHLYTEDFRLPALKTYLKTGYIPMLYDADMPERWRAVCEQLRWPFTPEQW